MMRQLWFVTVFALLVGCVTPGPKKIRVTLKTDPKATGHKLYYADSTKNVNQIIDIGNTSEHERFVQQDEVPFFVRARSYNEYGESDFSAWYRYPKLIKPQPSPFDTLTFSDLQQAYGGGMAGRARLRADEAVEVFKSEGAQLAGHIAFSGDELVGVGLLFESGLPFNLQLHLKNTVFDGLIDEVNITKDSGGSYMFLFDDGTSGKFRWRIQHKNDDPIVVRQFTLKRSE